MYTIDDLLAEISEVVNVPNMENYRSSIYRHVRRVLTRIGIDLIAKDYQEKMHIRAHYLELPSYVLKVEDGGEAPDIGEFYEIEANMRPLNTYSFRHVGNGLQFPNVDNKDVYVRFKGLPKSEDGEITIPEEAYTACYEYALGELLRTLPLHPRYREAGAMIQRAEQILIPEARVELQPTSTAKDRTHRHYMGSQQVRR